MNLLFTVCGRAGSMGVKGKNLWNFCGIPLLWYTLADKDRYLSKGNQIKTVLNTDSEDLVRLSAAVSDPPFFLKRDSAIARATASKVSVIRSCLFRAETHWNIAFDMIVDLDITSPLRTLEDIRAAIEKKRTRPDADVVYFVTPSRRNPYFNMVREEDGFFTKAVSSSFACRQQAPVFYAMNASIYVYTPKPLLEKRPETFLNDHTDIVVMLDTGILDIDSEWDYELMQVIAHYLFSQCTEFQEISERASMWLKS